MNKQITNISDKKIITWFLFWRLGLFLLDFWANKLLVFKPSFPYTDILAKFATPFFWQWANFDGVHYIMIAQNGYTSIYSGITQAFFPLYPLTIKFLSFFIHNFLFSGLLIANIFFLASLLVFKRFLISIKINPYFPLLLLLCFPTSYYFGAVYNESLFMFLSLSSCLLMEKKKWLLASLFISLAAATRITGLFLIIPLLGLYVSGVSLKNNKIIIKASVYVLIAALGFLAYSLYLYKNFHDFFYFATVQSKFGASRQTDKIILLYQVIWRYLKMFWTVNIKSLLFFTITQEFMATMSVLGLIILGFFKPIKSLNRFYLFYALAALILPTLTGNFSSMPRYVLVLFPIFIILDKLFKKRWQKTIIIFTFTILLIINTMLFLRGYWIA